MRTVFNVTTWVRTSFLSLLIVSLLGVLMRYKIAFALPFIDQKHILHAHSHFAFVGWITQLLMILLVHYLSKNKPDFNFARYKWLLYGNLISAYGMLFSFPFQGYGAVSIAFSLLSILISYCFALFYFKDLRSLKSGSVITHWFKAALLFSVLSSLGTFALSIMMATQTVHQNWYLASIYFYLHFQYNGWFFFAGMGLFGALTGGLISVVKQKWIFWLFTLACVPAYVLSALWLPLPEWIHAIVSTAAVMQLLAWIILLKELIAKRKEVLYVLNSGGMLFLLAGVALSIKLCLQLGSTFHFLSTLAFGFRPIVIGYLHLVLLGIITLSLIGFVLTHQVIIAHKGVKIAIAIFVSGIILNELLLLLQGVGAIAYIRIPLINELLLGAAIVMFGGTLLLNVGIAKK